jgi:hypothetical protein
MGGGRDRESSWRIIRSEFAGHHFIVQPLERRENSNMAQPQKGAGRKPATKFANLRKKMDQSKLRAKTPALRVRKSGNR